MKKLAVLFAIACGVTGAAYAQKPEWPAKQIKMLVPYGGTRPVIMNAGASATGQAFAIRNCDAFFGRRGCRLTRPRGRSRP